MHFVFSHNNLNVLNLDKSLDFYERALGLKVVRMKEAADHSFKLAFLGGWRTPPPAGADLAARPYRTL